MFRFTAFLALLAGVFLTNGCSGGEGDGDSLQPTNSNGPSSGGTVSATFAAGGLPDERVTFYAADAGDSAGAVISGDFNGDGATDVIFGAFMGDGPDNTRADAGEAYLFFGPFEAGGALDAGGQQYDSVFFGPAAGDQLGRALAVGDFNGDGLDDIAFGAPQSSESAGAIFVMFGTEDWPLEMDFASGAADVVLSGVDSGDYAGLILDAGALDEGDGDDLVIGALLGDGPANDREDSGEVYAVPGSSLHAGATIALADVAAVIYGANAGDRLGEAVATGNLDEDPADELAIVAPFADEGRGATYVLVAPPASAVDLATGELAQIANGADAGDQLGHSIGIGDNDGDGLGDIWLGAVSADGPENSADLAGEAMQVRGSGETALIYGPEKEARLGRSLAVADLSGDGLADLAIAAPNMSERAGVILLYEGGAELAAPSASYRGVDAGDILGHEAFGTPSISGADIAGDGRFYLLSSAAGGDGPDDDRTDAGEAYLMPVDQDG